MIGPARQPPGTRRVCSQPCRHQDDSGLGWTPSSGSFTWNFAPDSNSTYSSKIDFDQIGAGFGGHFWFGYAQPSDEPSSTVITGTWSPPSILFGWTDIEVAIPSYGANAAGAVYQVNTGTGGGQGGDIEINQSATAGTNAWVDLGEFYLGNGGSVSLSNVTPDVYQGMSEAGGDLAWSAMAFIPDTSNLNSHPYTYTAMGDSYASGEGNGPYDYGTAGACDRSPAAYGRQFAAEYSSIGDAYTQHIACSGATIADLTTTGQYPEQSQIAELKSLEMAPKLVTVTIGGNDLGFSGILTYCLTNPATCESNYNSDNADNLYTIMDDTLKAKLTSAYEAIKTAGNGAQVVAVTYPMIFQPGTTCTGILNLPVPDVQFLISVGLYLDNTIIAAAKAAGINVMDERYALLGHQLCSSDPWVYDLPTGFKSGTSVLDSSAWFHPTGAGLAQMANDLGQYWQALQQSAPPTVWPVPVPSTAPSGWVPLNLPYGIPTNAEATAMLNSLTVVPSHPTSTASGYSATAFGTWPGPRDGWTSRNRVLLAQALTVAQGAASGPVVGSGNNVITGTWQLPYDTNPSSPTMPATYTTTNSPPGQAVPIDHLVPRAEAWISGASQWATTYSTALTVTQGSTTVNTTQGGQMLYDFSNDLSGPELLAVSQSSNSSKSDSPPQTWLPPNQGMDCAYAKMWIAVKWQWDLNVLPVEQTVLEDLIAEHC